MRVLLAQINPTIGDLKGNTELILKGIEKGRQQKANLVVFPELALSGYPPEDFLLLPHFLEAVLHQLNIIIEASEKMTIIVGLPRKNPNLKEKSLLNSAAIIKNKKLLGFHDKILLPTYDVFDERRYFEPGEKPTIWTLDGKKIGITICEDIWQESGLVRSTIYFRNPIEELAKDHLDYIINISASPYSLNKFEKRYIVCQKVAERLKCPVLWCNQVGGNDSLIFDGYSFVLTSEGIVQIAKGFQEDDLFIDLEQVKPVIEVNREPIEDLYQALTLGIKDYFQKQGFKRACIGLSGGIDSALVACLATEALGPENVLALGMPSQFSAPESMRDAAQLAKNLGIAYKEISIEETFRNYQKILDHQFNNPVCSVTEENLQARIRGMILMAFSNNDGYIVLSTGNKSEMAMGYSTLYGDMCGGLGVLLDVTKQQIYTLANWINRKKEIIPKYTIQRAPSAELCPNQKDSDTLPPYDIIDNVTTAYLEDHLSSQQIAEKFQYPLELVDYLLKKIHQNEYKRRQAPPGLRVSEKAFSVGRRFPIVQKWSYK